MHDCKISINFDLTYSSLEVSDCRNVLVNKNKKLLTEMTSKNKTLKQIIIIIIIIIIFLIFFNNNSNNNDNNDNNNKTK